MCTQYVCTYPYMLILSMCAYAMYVHVFEYAQNHHILEKVKILEF